MLFVLKELKDASLVGTGRSTHLKELCIPKDETFRLMHTYPCNHTQMLKAAPEPNWRTAELILNVTKTTEGTTGPQYLPNVWSMANFDDLWQVVLRALKERLTPALCSPFSQRSSPLWQIWWEYISVLQLLQCKAVYQSAAENRQIWPCLEVQTLLSVLCWGVAEERDRTPILRKRSEQGHINGWDHSGGERDWVGGTTWHWAARRATPTEGSLAHNNQPNF